MVAVAQPTVLISGAGIAGPFLAHWLAKNGYRVIVVEIAKGIRPGGQTVDLRGAGGEVVERMGLPSWRSCAATSSTSFTKPQKKPSNTASTLGFQNFIRMTTASK
ncbi:MAG: hypothetical protein QOJ24_1552 [Mycobacterium sp.]|nr:hypothetical protein [Mycobacterium sp.]